MREFNDEDYPAHSRITPDFEQSGDCSEFSQELEQRKKIASAFFWQYIADDLPPVPGSEQAIDAIAELISYGDDLDLIKQKMALQVEV